jgi:hypothetical protein
MPGTNISLILQTILAATNNLASNAPQVVNFDFANPTLIGTDFYYNPFVQAPTTGQAITLPASPVFAILVQNQSTSGILQVAYTPTGQASTISTIGPAGVVILFDPLETGGGWTALTLTGIGGTIPAAVLVGV